MAKPPSVDLLLGYGNAVCCAKPFSEIKNFGNLSNKSLLDCLNHPDFLRYEDYFLLTMFLHSAMAATRVILNVKIDDKFHIMPDAFAGLSHRELLRQRNLG